MYLTAITAEGLVGDEPLTVGTDERAPALPEGLGAARVADAVELWAGALDPERLPVAAGRVFASHPTRVGEGEDSGLDDLDPGGVGAVVGAGPSGSAAPHNGETRAVTVEARVALDRTLYGRMREHAHRDPRLVSALSGGTGELAVKVGWLFSRDLRRVSPAVLQVRAGDVAFETSGKERPAWLPGLLATMSRRVQRTDPFEPTGALAVRLHEASLSADPEVRRGYARILAAAVEAPFSLPVPGLVRDGASVALCFGPELRRLRAVGREAWDALRWLEALWIVRPDVLIVPERVPVEVRAWIAELVERDGAPVEQVWLG